MAILLLGTCAYILLPNIKSDAAFSTLLLNYLPVGLRGIVFASLLAISTISSWRSPAIPISSVQPRTSPWIFIRTS